jgi:hypothetical protein
VRQFATPTIGSCTVTTGSFLTIFPYQNLTYRFLDAGSAITVSGPNGTRTANRTIDNDFGETFISYDAGEIPVNFLTTGRYTVSGPGGPDVGSFTGSLDAGNDLVWTNWEEAKTVNRGRGLTVRWTGGDPSSVIIISGFQSAGLTDSASFFTCFANRSAGSFHIPGSILSQLPASPSLSGFSIRGDISISSGGNGFGSGIRLNASGVDYMVVTEDSGASVNTLFQ